MLQHTAIACFHCLLEQRQRGSTCLCVHITAGKAQRARPSRHLYREGDKQEDTSYQRGVEGVLPDAAERHLTYTYGYQCANQHYPPRHVARQVEGEQQTRQDGGAVAYHRRFLEQKLRYQPLEQHAGCHADGRCYQCAPAELNHRHHICRQQSGYHEEHILPDAVVIVNMRSRRYN